MCGIVGMVSKNQTGFTKQDQDIFRTLLYVDAVRGEDSTGIFGVNKYGNLEFLKSATDPTTFLKTKSYKDFDDKIYSKFKMVVGHNRKATFGTIKDENAHPFVEGNVALVHNGTLFNHKNSLKDVEVDSHAICHSIAEHGYKETFKKINGAFAISWYDAESKTLSLVRNKERPLSIFETPTTWYFASENLMLYWVLLRHGIAFELIKKFDLEPNEINFFSLEDTSIRHTEVLEEVYKEPTKKIIGMPTKTGQHSVIKHNIFDISETVLCKLNKIVEFNKESIADTLETIQGYFECKEVTTDSIIKLFYTSSKLEEVLKEDTNFFDAKIQSIVGTIEEEDLTYYSNVYSPTVPVYDQANKVISKLVFDNLEKQECKYCGQTLKIEDIPQSRIKYVNRKNTKLVCKTCLTKLKEKKKT